MKNHDKKEYLVGKLIDGAKALNDLFKETFIDNSTNPNEFYKDLSSKYELTKNQKEYLKKVASRVSKAKEIVEYLKEKYGVRKDDYIKDKKGLYKLMFEKDPPKTYFSAKAHPFVIEFYLPQNLFDKGIGGNAGSGNRYPLDYILNHNLKQIKKGKTNYESLRALTFKVNNGIARSKSDRLKFLYKALGVNIKKFHIEQHELKHIIDDLIDSQQLQTKEISAYLFTGEIDPLIINKDIKPLRKNLDESITRYKKLKELNSPQCILDNEKDLIKIKAWKIKQVKNFPISTVERINENGLGTDVISYIVATTNLNNLAKRIKLVDEHLEKNTIKEKDEPASDYD